MPNPSDPKERQDDKNPNQKRGDQDVERQREPGMKEKEDEQIRKMPGQGGAVEKQ